MNPQAYVVDGGCFHRCQRFIPSTAVVAHSMSEVKQAAVARSASLSLLTMPQAEADIETFRASLASCSQEGSWAVVPVLTEDEAPMLREALHRVWLRCTWEHHASFRFWIVLSFVQGNLYEWANATGKFLLAASSLFRSLCESFHDEFQVRELLAAVLGRNIFAIESNRHSVTLMHPWHVVEMFRACPDEESFLALVAPPRSQAVCRAIADARDAEGLSVLDLTFPLHYVRAAAVLQDFGCRSEAFGFDVLLRPESKSLLVALLDPKKPLPFDAKRSAATVAECAGRSDLMRRMWTCRIDADFLGRDYPLVEACRSGDEAMVHAVLDRMGDTGVAPNRDGSLATYYLPRVIMGAWQVQSPSVARHAVGTIEGLSSITVWVCDRLLTCMVEDEVHTPINAEVLRRLQAYPRLLAKALRVTAQDAVADPVDMLRFFIQAGPSLDGAARAAERAVEACASEGGDVDERVFRLLLSILQAGPSRVPLFRAAFSRALFLDAISCVHRSEGRTLLMEAATIRSPNPAAAQAFTEVCIEQRQGLRAVAQVDSSGNNALQRLVVDVSQNYEAVAGQVEWVLSDVVHALVAARTPAAVQPPRFSGSLFSLAARVGAGYLCLELLGATDVARPETVIGSTTLQTQLRMVERALGTPHGEALLCPTASSRLPLRAWSVVAAFLPVSAIPVFSSVSRPTWYASIADEVWRYRLPATSDSPDRLDPLCGAAFLEMKAIVFRRRRPDDQM